MYYSIDYMLNAIDYMLNALFNWLHAQHFIQLARLY